MIRRRREFSRLPFETVKTDIKAKTTEGGDDYKKTNPLGYVPALALDDGTILTEGPAIVQYVADKVPEKKLAPANGTLERYRLQELLGYINSEIHKSYGPLFNPNITPEAKEYQLATLRKRFDLVETWLAGKQYLMGDKFTVADAYLFVMVGWAGHVGLDLSALKNVGAFHARVAARPAVQAAMKAEGLIK